MKHLTPLFFTLLTFSTLSKTPSHYLTFSYSNNGQIYDVMDQYYFTQGAYLPNNDVFNYKQSDLKFNFSYEYVTPKNIAFFCKVGYSDRKDSYTISNVTPANGNKEQNYLEIAVGAKYVLEGDKFQFSGGVEIPYYKISTYKEKFFWENPAQIIHTTQATDGGTVYGINTIYSAKFFFTKSIFVSTDLAFGLLVFDLGGTTQTTFDYQNPVIYGPEKPYDNSYKKITVSKPEFYFGIGIKL